MMLEYALTSSNYSSYNLNDLPCDLGVNDEVLDYVNRHDDGIYGVDELLR